MKPKYYVSDRMFGLGIEKTDLFSDLYSAIRGCFWSKSSITPIPTAWGTKAPLKEYSSGRAWQVQSRSVHEDGQVYEFGWADFNDPLDAFFFAEAKEKRDNYGARPTKWFVLLMWWDEAGRYNCLERLPATWLTQQQRARERAEKRAQRLTRRDDLAA